MSMSAGEIVIEMQLWLEQNLLRLDESVCICETVSELYKLIQPMLQQHGRPCGIISDCAGFSARLTLWEVCL